MARVQLDGIGKVYPGGQHAVHDVDLDVADGELIVLVGPSGCGKSTLLRLIAGLESPSTGRVLIGDRDVTTLPPQERDVAMVFQSYALYPHRTVRENLAFGLRMRGATSIDERVRSTAKALGLESMLDRKPRELSGGQRQRVALGRAIVREPKAFLLDEPLSNLDARLRVRTRAELARLHHRLRATMVYVTHDQEEAMVLGDRVAVLRNGELQQVDSPMTVYRRPANTFVAGFIGSPAMNLLRARLLRREDGSRVETPAFTLSLDARMATAGGEAWLGVRPQDVEVVNAGTGDVDGRVVVIEPLGNQLIVHVEVPGVHDEEPLRVVAPPDARLALDERVSLRFRRDHMYVFDGNGRRVSDRTEGA